MRACIYNSHLFVELEGLIELQEGDAVFARDIGQHGDAMEDSLQILIATK